MALTKHITDINKSEKAKGNFRLFYFGKEIRVIRDICKCDRRKKCKKMKNLSKKSSCFEKKMGV